MESESTGEHLADKYVQFMIDEDQRTLEAIVAHHDTMIAACKTAIGNIIRVPRERRGKLLDGQLKYWRHANAALVWSKKLAIQMYRTKHARPRKTVQ